MKHTRNRILLTISFILISTAGILAQTKKEIKQKIRERDKYFYSGTVKQSSFNETIHFQMVHGEIIIAITINGKIYNFGFDTGAPTIVSPALAKELNLEKTGTFNMRDGTDTSRANEGYTIKELQIGNITFNNTGCMASDLSAINKGLCTKIDGIIGVNLMHECYLKMKFDDSTLNFSNKLQLIPPTALAMNFVEDFGKSPYMKMQYGDSSLYAEFDCGDNGPMNIPAKKVAKQLSSAFVSGYGATVQTFYQKIVEKKSIGIVDSLQIGGVGFRHKLTYLSEARAFATIGTSFMKGYESTIDWKKHKIYLNPLSDAIDTSFSMSYGLTFAADSGVLKVDFLWQGSQAEKDGIRAGDRIVSLNGINTTTTTGEQFCALFKTLTHTLKLTTRDAAGNEKAFVLDKYDMVKR